jgi:hypothetical protein
MSCGAVVDLTASRLNPAAERTVQVWSDRGYAGADLTTRQVTSWAPCAAVAANPAMVHDVIAATPNPLTLKDEVFTKWITRDVQQAPADDALTAELWAVFVRVVVRGSVVRMQWRRWRWLIGCYADSAAGRGRVVVCSRERSVWRSSCRCRGWSVFAVDYR